MAKKVRKFNLSDHTLDINVRKCNYDRFDFSEVEEYVEALVGSRDYQYEAIKSIMIYLWGGSYKNITHLARENWKTKPAIQERFQSEENFLRMLPLPDRLSGVVHMATGTGKSYVMFAIAYLSIALGKVKRVLVLGPSSTVIEAGLTGKFREYLFGEKGLELRKKLPQKYRNVHINLLNDNNPIVDNSIVIENINSIYNKDRNSIGDTLFSGTDEVLVLSDEVHHAYSHLKYTGTGIAMDGEGGTGDTRDERLWMKFIREENKIRRHIGFTGTPYNQDEYFCDVIYSYSIKEAMEAKFIKKIDPIIRTESDEGDVKLSTAQKFEQILITHERNKEKYSYKNKKGQVLLKPITIFINSTQAFPFRREP
jgi:type III restriction enzyme